MSDIFYYEIQIFVNATQDFPGGSVVKNLPANARDAGSISQFRRSPGEGNSNTLEYTCLGNPMDRGAWRATVYGVTKSWARLSVWACMSYIFLPPSMNHKSSKVTEWEKCPYLRCDQALWSVRLCDILLFLGELSIMEKALGIFHNCYFSPFPVGARRGSFSAFHPENLVGFLEVKSRKLCPQKTLATRDFSPTGWSNSISSSLSKLLVKCFYQFVIPVVSGLQVSRS